MSPIERVRRYCSDKPRRYFVGFAAVALSLIILILPSAYSTEWPGPTANVLGSADGETVIKVDDAKTYDDSGRLLLLTVSANGVPGYPITNAEALWAWISPGREVMPREAVVPVGQTAEEYAREGEREMGSSQDNAVAAATTLLADQGIDASEAKVRMHIDDIGGPSGGMMYALGLIDKLTPESETGGRTIAGTGTMSKDGKVGSIGGIRLKMLAAKRDGATWFLAPKANCDEVVGHVPQGLRDVRVSTLSEAYDALVAIGQGKADGLPRCEVR